MNTSLTMLDGMRGGDDSAWSRFDQAYSRFIRSQLGKMLFIASDVDEVSQEVMLTLFDKMKRFERQRDGSFRTYLRGICRFKALEQLAKNCRDKSEPDSSTSIGIVALEQLADPKSELSQIWDRDHRQFAQETILSEASKRCGRQNVELFMEMQRKERSRESIAESAGVSPATLYRIQAEVALALQELREEWQEVLDL